VRTIKLFAVIGLAVALVAVPALTQTTTRACNVTCDAASNKIKVSLNSDVLVLKCNETARWVFRRQQYGKSQVQAQSLQLPLGQTSHDRRSKS
jgi:hypothetical protein